MQNVLLWIVAEALPFLRGKCLSMFGYPPFPKGRQENQGLNLSPLAYTYWKINQGFKQLDMVLLILLEFTPYTTFSCSFPQKASPQHSSFSVGSSGCLTAAFALAQGRHLSIPQPFPTEWSAAASLHFLR